MSDESDGPRLTRRRLLGGIGTVGTASVIGGAGTWAAFRDDEDSNGNYVQAGTLDLTLSDSDESDSDGVSGEITLQNAAPGDTFSGDITLKNAGSLEADHVELAFSYQETEANGPNGNNEADTAPNSAAGMAEQLEATTLFYNGTNVRSNLGDANGNGRRDLDDLTRSANDGALNDLTPPPSANGGTESLVMELKFADDPANNDYQGDEVTFTITMALHQSASQDL